MRALLGSGSDNENLSFIESTCMACCLISSDTDTSLSPASPRVQLTREPAKESHDRSVQLDLEAQLELEAQLDQEALELELEVDEKLVIEDQKNSSQVEHTAQTDDEHMHARQKSDLPNESEPRAGQNEAGQNGAGLLQSRSRLHAEGQEGLVKEGRPFEGILNAGIVTPGKAENKNSGGKTGPGNPENKSGGSKTGEGVETRQINREPAVSGNVSKVGAKMQDLDDVTENSVQSEDEEREGQKQPDSANVKMTRPDKDNHEGDDKNMAEIEASEVYPGNIKATKSAMEEETSKNSTDIEDDSVEKGEAGKKLSDANSAEVKADKKSKATKSDLETVAATGELQVNDSREMSRDSGKVEARRKIVQTDNNLTQTQSSVPTFNSENGGSKSLHNDVGEDGMSTLVEDKIEVEEVVNELDDPGFLTLEEEGEKKGKKEEEEEGEEGEKEKEEDGGDVINELDTRRRFLTLEEKARALGLEVSKDLLPINLGLEVGEEEEAMREREGRQQSFFEKEVSKFLSIFKSFRTLMTCSLTRRAAGGGQEGKRSMPASPF